MIYIQIDIKLLSFNISCNFTIEDNIYGKQFFFIKLVKSIRLD